MNVWLLRKGKREPSIGRGALLVRSGAGQSGGGNHGGDGIKIDPGGRAPQEPSIALGDDRRRLRTTGSGQLRDDYRSHQSGHLHGGRRWPG